MVLPNTVDALEVWRIPKLDFVLCILYYVFCIMQNLLKEWRNVLRISILHNECGPLEVQSERYENSANPVKWKISVCSINL